jgi:hypothetical protein
MLANDFIQLYIILIAIGCGVVFVVKVILSIIKNSKIVEYVNNFSQFRSILEYHMEKAYEMIHKEHILTYSLDAFRIDEKDYDKISKEFVKLVSKFLGPSLLKEFINLYGDVDTYTFNVLDYFSVRYENDEIRNTALEQITEAEIDEQN